MEVSWVAERLTTLGLVRKSLNPVYLLAMKPFALPWFSETDCGEISPFHRHIYTARSLYILGIVRILQDICLKPTDREKGAFLITPVKRPTQH